MHYTSPILSVFCKEMLSLHASANSEDPEQTPQNASINVVYENPSIVGGQSPII